VPTYTERLVWGNGDGRGLEAVSTSAGRIGGLICWEHWMPLARVAMHNSGEHIHVAAWPTVPDDAGCGRTSGASTRRPTFVR
jgi:nitrilase